MTIPNYSQVKLLSDRYLSEGVKAGAIGYIIEVYLDGYEVEFSDNDGTTIALLALTSNEFFVI